MKSLKENIILWAILALVILYRRISYPWGFFFTLIDPAFIAAAFLVFNGRIYTAFAVAGISGALADFTVMPFFGFHFSSSIAGVAALWFLTQNIYRDNYLTKVLVVAAGMAITGIFYLLLVFVFHWGLTIHYLPAMAFPKIAATTLAAAAAIKLAEIFEERFRKWLRKI